VGVFFLASLGMTTGQRAMLLFTTAFMPKTRDQKSAVMDRLTQEFKGAKSVAFANYQGITVAQADELRKNARAANVSYVVAKKTLFTRAAKEAGYDLDTKQFPGMIGAAFAAEDDIAPAKVLGDMTKKSPLVLVGGIFDGQPVPKEKVEALSKLPGKMELLAMLVGTLNGVPGAFVRALNALREKQEAGAPAPKAEAPAAAPAPAEAAPVVETAAEAAPETPAAAPSEAPAEEQKEAASEAPAAEPPAAQ
jgi:large subunit ribosomal protein L10